MCQRQSEDDNREAIYQMLASLTVMAEQLAVVSGDIVQLSDASPTDQRALTYDRTVRDLLTQALHAMAVATDHELEPFSITSSVTDRIKIAFQLSDQAIQTAMRISHSKWLPHKVAAIGEAQYVAGGRTNDGRNGDGG